MRLIRLIQGEESMLRSPRSSVAFEPSPNFGNWVSTNTLRVHTNMDGGWSVRRHGSRRSIRKFATKSEAVRLARKIARKWKADFVIHGHDASVVAVVSYADDVKHSRSARR